MNILYVGQYRDRGLDGKISRDYLELLIECGYNISALPIQTTKSINNLSDNILGVEKNRFKTKPDLVIQSVPPEMIVKCDTKSIGIYNIAQLRDKNEALKKVDLLDGFISPTIIDNPKITYIYPYNDTIINSEAEEINDLDHTFNFCFMDEYSDVANLTSLIKAFNREFLICENVRLVIYSWIADKKPKESVDLILEDISTIKKCLGLYDKDSHYISDLVVTPNLDRNNILQLIRQSHCLVLPNRECFVSQFATDAITLNKHILFTENIGIQAFIEEFSQSYDKIHSYRSLITNNSRLKFPVECREIDIFALKDKMREVYNKRESLREDAPCNIAIKEKTLTELKNVISKICD